MKILWVRPRWRSAVSLRPFPQQVVDPIWDGNSSNVTSLSSWVHDCPTLFTLLEVAEIRRGELMATKSTRQQDGKQGPITFSFQQLAIWGLPSIAWRYPR
jgi:hypothetical protein